MTHIIEGYLPLVNTTHGPTALIPTVDGVRYDASTTLGEKLAAMIARLEVVEQGGGIALVLAPNFLSPAPEGTVIAPAVSIVTTSLACGTGLTDTHKSTAFKITSDEEGNDVIAVVYEAPRLTSHTFLDVPITAEGTYYLWARHTGVKYGAGPWAKLAVTILNGFITPGGRVVYRHSSNMGTVLEFNDGAPRKVLVLDAVHRGKMAFGAYGTDTPLTNYTSTNASGSWYLNTGNSANIGGATVLTDAQINAMWRTAHDANTAKKNGDVWITKGATAPTYTRGITVDGVGCDIPNNQTIMRIFLEANFIDSLDPTVAANRSKALGHQNTTSYWDCMGTRVALTSTEYSANYIRYISVNASCHYGYKSTVYFCIPILEL